VYTWTQFGNGSFDWSSSRNWASSGTAVSGAGNSVVFGEPTGAYSAGFTTTSNLNYGGSFVLNQLQLTGSSNAESESVGGRLRRWQRSSLSAGGIGME